MAQVTVTMEEESVPVLEAEVTQKTINWTNRLNMLNDQKAEQEKQLSNIQLAITQTDEKIAEANHELSLLSAVEVVE